MHSQYWFSEVQFVITWGFYHFVFWMKNLGTVFVLRFIVEESEEKFWLLYQFGKMKCWCSNLVTNVRCKLILNSYRNVWYKLLLNTGLLWAKSVRKHPEEYQSYGGFYMPVKNNATLLCCKPQDRKIAKLKVATWKHCYVGSCQLGTMLSWKLQDRNIAKLQLAR